MLLLNEKEKKAMSGLYKFGKASVSELSKDSMINRTTLYPVLGRLLNRGLVSKISVEGRTIFKPISNEEFREVIKRKEKETIINNKRLLGWLEEQEKSKQPSLLSEVNYFEGFEGVKNLYSDTWRSNKEKIIYAITDYKSAYETMGNYFRNEYFSKRIKHGVRVKNLLPMSEEGKKDFKTAKSFLREMKFIKLFKNLEIEINIYDSRVAIIAFDKKKP